MKWRIIGILVGILLTISGFLVLATDVLGANSEVVGATTTSQRVDSYEYDISRILGLVEAGKIKIDLTYSSVHESYGNVQTLMVSAAAPVIGGGNIGIVLPSTAFSGCTLTDLTLTSSTNIAATQKSVLFSVRMTKSYCTGAIRVQFNGPAPANTLIWDQFVNFYITMNNPSGFIIHPSGMDMISTESGVHVCSLLPPGTTTPTVATIIKPDGTFFLKNSDTDYCWSFETDMKGIWIVEIRALINNTSQTTTTSFFVPELRNPFYSMTGIPIPVFLALQGVFIVGVVIWHRSTDLLIKISLSILIAFLGLIWLYLWLEVHWNPWMFVSQFNFLVAAYLLFAGIYEDITGKPITFNRRNE